MSTKESASRRAKQLGPAGALLTMPCPFEIIADTREQLDYRFEGFRADAKQQRRLIEARVIRKAIQPGDYSIEGMEDTVRIERKSKDDLFGTIGGARERFSKRLNELSEFPVARVVVEAVWAEIVLFPPRHSQMRHKNIFRTISAWQFEFPSVHWWFCPTRRFAEEATFRILWRAWEMRENLCQV